MLQSINIFPKCLRGKVLHLIIIEISERPVQVCLFIILVNNMFFEKIQRLWLLGLHLKRISNHVCVVGYVLLFLGAVSVLFSMLMSFYQLVIVFLIYLVSRYITYLIIHLFRTLFSCLYIWSFTKMHSLNSF